MAEERILVVDDEEARAIRQIVSTLLGSQGYRFGMTMSLITKSWESALNCWRASKAVGGKGAAAPRKPGRPCLALPALGFLEE